MKDFTTPPFFSYPVPHTLFGSEQIAKSPIEPFLSVAEKGHPSLVAKRPITSHHLLQYQQYHCNYIVKVLNQPLNQIIEGILDRGLAKKGSNCIFSTAFSLSLLIATM